MDPPFPKLFSLKIIFTFILPKIFSFKNSVVPSVEQLSISIISSGFITLFIFNILLINFFD